MPLDLEVSEFAAQESLPDSASPAAGSTQ